MKSSRSGTASDAVPAAALPDMSLMNFDRVERMATNKKRLDDLRLKEDTDEMIKEAVKTQEQQQEKRKQTKEAAKRRKQEQQAEAAARSPRPSRNEGSAKPTYNENEAFKLVQEVEKTKRAAGGAKKRKKKQSSAGCSSKERTTTTSKYISWSPITPRTPKEARQAAREAAHELAREIKNPALVKVMLKSMVSGGFWLSSGNGLAKFLAVDSDITFTCDDTTRPVEVFKHNQKQGELRERKWDVKHIQSGESGGFGFSANWRGFAKDQFLHAGDVVVFEVTSKTTLNAHIFRAWDYADPDSKPADLEEHRFERVTGDLVAAALAAADEYSDDFSEDEEDEAALQRPAPASSSRGSSKAAKQQQKQQKSESAGAAAGAAKGKGSKSSSKAAAAPAAGKAQSKDVAAGRAEEGGTSKAGALAEAKPAAGGRGGSSGKGNAAGADGSGKLAGSKRKAAAAADADAVADLQGGSSGHQADQDMGQLPHQHKPVAAADEAAADAAPHAAADAAVGAKGNGRLSWLAKLLPLR